MPVHDGNYSRSSTQSQSKFDWRIIRILGVTFMGFTENFNYCMEQRGYSAYKFAKIIDVNIQSPVNWKAGSVIPHKKTRQKIAEHFGITLAELDGDELPVLPPEGAKKAPAAKGEGISAERKALLDIVYSLTDEQCRKLLVLVQGAKTVL